MAVGKPDFDLNSFGVKYLSKDQVQDFLEIKKRKDMGDVGQDPDTPGLEGKEVSTNEITGHKTVRPKPVKRGGFKGRSMRRVVNGEKVKVPQTEEETTPPEGQVPTSRKNDVQFGKLGEESTSEVRESFDMITNSPKYQEEINRDAPLTEKEGTEKFDNADPKVQAARKRIAAREHKKKLAAEKKKKKNKKKANDIIMDMNIMKLDLMKDSKDGKQSKDGLPKNGELKDLISGDDTREHVAEATRLGNEKRDIDEEFKKRYGFKNTPKNWKRFGRKNRMSGGTKESLKSDLMKDGIQGGGKNVPSDVDDKYGEFYQHKEGQAEKVRSNNPFSSFREGDSRVQGKRPIKGDKPKVDPRIRERDWTSEERREAESHSHPHAGDQDATQDAIYGVDEQYTGNKAPADLKRKAAETIFKATSLKLDLMKGKGYSKTNTQRFHPDLPDNHPYNFDETTRTGNYKGAKIHGDKDDKKRAFKKIDDDIEAGKVKEIESATLNASKLIKSDSAETIFKAISLKLDLMNKKSRFKPSNPLHRNIHPNNMGKQNDPYYKNVDLSYDFDKDSDKDAAEYQKKLESDMEKKIRAKIEDETRYDHYGRDL
jgi:hypothetical protein